MHGLREWFRYVKNQWRLELAASEALERHQYKNRSAYTTTELTSMRPQAAREARA
jgi:hypothetical protein